MTRHLARVFLIGFALALFARTAACQSAQMLSFNGPLRDLHGNAVATPVDLIFRIYDAPIAGNLVAGPFGPNRVAPIAGEYSTTFGPVPVGQFDGPRWLEITLAGSALTRIEMEKVYHDWLDESGKLTGNQTLKASTPMALDALAPQGLQRSTTSVSTILNNGPSSNRVDLVFVGDGYVASQLGTYAGQAQALLNNLLSQEPFLSYRTFFNAHRVDVISNQSGVDHDPTYGILRDTALDMGFFCGGTARAICVDGRKVLQFAALAPAMDQMIALANSTTYGGTGYTDLAVIAGGNFYAGEVGIHEMGHSFGNLADEYEYGGPETYTGGELTEPNISILTAPPMAASGTKWARWLGDPGAGFGGVVSTYEGGGYSYYGIYRPTYDSKMRNLFQPFNRPSVESLILELYRLVRPIDNATPAGTLLDEFSTVFVDPVDPPGHPLEIQWFIDGNPVAGQTHETLRLCTGEIPLGDHVVSVTVRDPTPWVRDEAERNQWLTESRSWNLHSGGSNLDDCALLVTAPGGVSGDEGSPLSFTVQAVDPDGDAITFLTAAGTAIIAGGTFTADPSNTSGTFQWTPGYDRAGTYAATFTAANALRGSATTWITVRNVNLPPSVSAPASVSGAENALITFAVSAADPDGETIPLTIDLLPSNATFLDHENSTGTFSWVPGFDQAGSYLVTFTALDGSGASGTVQTGITVAPTDRAPAIVAPPVRTINEGESLTFFVTASDPDGEPILSLTTPSLPGGATFVLDGAGTTGTFAWIPGYSQAGTHSVTFVASNALQGTAATSILVNNVARGPVVATPNEVVGAEGSALAFSVSATDPDGEAIDSLTAASLPFGSTFTVDPERTSGEFQWTPDYTQSGEYAVTISAQSACRATVVSGIVEVECDAGTATVAITIADVNRAPIPNPGGPYSGVFGIPVAFEGGQSSDPDGNGLRYYWDFDASDGITTESTSQSPEHTYAVGGSYTVTLTVDDGGAPNPGSPVLTASGTTSANIQSAFAARVFSKNGSVRLQSGKPAWCAQIEPVSGGFELGEVNTSSVVMKYGTRQIAAVAGKAAVIEDKDRNGIMELGACWSKADLRTLFAGLPAGHNTVIVTVEGNLTTGGGFTGTMSVDVVGNGSFLAVWVSPNPPQPQATLTIQTTKPGFARIHLFDLMGRLARTLLDEPYLPAGYHDVTIDGLGKSGDRLPSGVYFYRVEASEGVSSGRLSIMR